MTKNRKSPDQEPGAALPEPGRLENAVDQIRRSVAPTEASERSIDRALRTVSAAAAVRSKPARSQQRRLWLRFVIGATCLSLLLGVGALGRSLREAARRVTVTNEFEQIGLAVHNYADPATNVLWAQTPATARYSRGSRDRSVIPYYASVPAAAGVSKTIHSASLVLVVEEISETDDSLRRLIDRMNGSIGNSSVTEPIGKPRTANWVVRIPVESLDNFMLEVVELGTPENRSTNASDVTEEYIDLNTRIENKRQLEKRILDLLETNTGDIKDVLAVEEQMARVRD